MFNFLTVVGKLKVTYRAWYTDDKREESTAEHTWRLMFMLMLVVEEFKLKVDLLKAFKMALVHDLAECLPGVGDTDAYYVWNGNTSKEDQHSKERNAMLKLRKQFPEFSWVVDIWDEYQLRECPEAKLIKALDGLEGFKTCQEMGVERYSKDKKFFWINYNDIAVSNYPDLEPLSEEIKSHLRKMFEEAGIECREKTTA